MKCLSSLAMRRYSVEPTTRKYKKQIFDTGLDAVKLLPKK